MFFETLLKELPKDQADAIRFDYVVNIQNVFEYYMKVDTWNIEDFPNVASPFNFMFMEFKFDNSLYSGMEIVTFDANDAPPNEMLREKRPPDAKWISFFLLYMKPKETGEILFMDEEIPYSAFWEIAVDKNGSICKSPKTQKPWVAFTPPNYIDESAYPLYYDCLYPCLLAISFMHCKNVVVTEKGSAKPTGKRNRHGPHFRYHVLEIEPMKQVLKHEGQSEATGIKRALHICRGHFKDYREHGLFGRNKEIYWWESHVRGNVDQGIVDKDYSINPPKDDV